MISGAGRMPESAKPSRNWPSLSRTPANGVFAHERDCRVRTSEGQEPSLEA